MPSAKQFLGYQFYRPGAYGAFQTRADPPAPSEYFFTHIIIGRADNGPDCNDESLDFEGRYIQGTFDHLKGVIKSGELMDAVSVCRSPSTDPRFAGGPRSFVLLNVNPNTAAHITVPSAEPGVEHTIRARVPGPAGNRIRIRKQGRKLEIGERDPATSFDADLDALQLAYTGDATQALLEITPTRFRVALTGQTDGTADLDIDLGVADNLGELAAAVTAAPGYQATALLDLVFKTAHLDAVEDLDIRTERVVTADLYAEEIVLAANGLAVMEPGAVRKPLADTGTFLFLSGGATGTPPADAYLKAVDFAELVDGMHVSILSSSPAVAKYLSISVYNMNTPRGRGERLGSCGAGSLTTLDERLEAIRTLDSSYMVYGGESFRAFAGAERKVFPGYFLGALCLAVKAAASPIYSPTRKPLNIIGPAEHDQRAKDRLLKAGGLIVEYFPQISGRAAPAITRAATTTRSANNEVLMEIDGVAKALGCVRRIRLRVDPASGEPITDPDVSPEIQSITIPDIQSLFEGELEALRRDGFLGGDAALGIPAWSRDYKLRRDGTAIYVEDADGNITPLMNFFFFLLNLGYIRGTAGE